MLVLVEYVIGMCNKSMILEDYTHVGTLSFAVALQHIRERSGSVVECLTRDRRAAGSSLTGVTALLSLSKTYLS